MELRATGLGVEVWAPAKLNLFLEVVARRSDGYHELETLMVPVSLYDTLIFRTQPSGPVTLTCLWADSAQTAHLSVALPEGAENTVVRSVELLKDRFGLALGASIQLIKRIPAAAGLAGGSSDAAAALVAANLAWGARLSSLQLRQLAAEIGSDVPFFLDRGAAICRGRGELIEPLDGVGLLHFVVVYPQVGLRTADVYRRCRPADCPRSAEPLVRALRNGNLDLAGRLLLNRLQPPAASLTPWIDRLKTLFDRFDLAGHQMSGSGSSYFGLCRNARQARQIARKLQALNVGAVYAVRSCQGLTPP